MGAPPSGLNNRPVSRDGRMLRAGPRLAGRVPGIGGECASLLANAVLRAAVVRRNRERPRPRFARGHPRSSGVLPSRPSADLHFLAALCDILGCR